MICLAIGLGVLGMVAMRRARRCHGGGHWHGWHRGGHGRWHRHHGYGRRSWMMHAALERIDASPAQERAIIAEIEKLQERVHGAKRNLKDARGDLSAAVRGPVLDDAALGAVLGRVDATTVEARAAMIDALRNIHAVLDDGQRAAQIVVEVDDAGPGVAPDRRADAFRAFVPSSGGGLGLGLALVSRIAVAHGGGAWISERPGGGARVGFAVGIRAAA